MWRVRRGGTFKGDSTIEALAGEEVAGHAPHVEVFAARRTAGKADDEFEDYADEYPGNAGHDDDLFSHFELGEKIHDEGEGNDDSQESLTTQTELGQSLRYLLFGGICHLIPFAMLQARQFEGGLR